LENSRYVCIEMVRLRIENNNLILHRNSYSVESYYSGLGRTDESIFRTLFGGIFVSVLTVGSFFILFWIGTEVDGNFFLNSGSIIVFSVLCLLLFLYWISSEPSRRYYNELEIITTDPIRKFGYFEAKFKKYLGASATHHSIQHFE